MVIGKSLSNRDQLLIKGVKHFCSLNSLNPFKWSGYRNSATLPYAWISRNTHKSPFNRRWYNNTIHEFPVPVPVYIRIDTRSSTMRYFFNAVYFYNCFENLSIFGRARNQQKFWTRFLDGISVTRILFRAFATNFHRRIQNPRLRCGTIRNFDASILFFCYLFSWKKIWTKIRTSVITDFLWKLFKTFITFNDDGWSRGNRFGMHLFPSFIPADWCIEEYPNYRKIKFSRGLTVRL